MSKLAIMTVLSCLLGAAAYAGQPPSGICPAGYSATFNVNQPGCTLCAAPTECAVQCLGPPACACPPGDKACCDATPCCFNCPGEGSTACNVSTCECEPEGCCSLVCPAAIAPASSTAGLGVLAAVLLAFGAGAVRIATRRR
jgi:hypothetical protein